MAVPAGSSSSSTRWSSPCAVMPYTLRARRPFGAASTWERAAASSPASEPVIGMGAAWLRAASTAFTMPRRSRRDSAG